MEREQLAARAIAKAREERIRVYKQKGRPGLFWAWSHSEPTKKYVIVVREEDEVCSCRGFYYRQSCKHVEQLRNRLARTGEREIFLVK